MNNSIRQSTGYNAKAVITLFMLVLTFINPLLFIVPTVLCGYTLSKSNPI